MDNKMKSFKFLTILSAAFIASVFTSCSDNSSSAEGDSFDASVVCPADGLNAYGEPNRGTFTDARDGQVYKYTTIGNQVWMAENLKFDAPYSVCYEKIEGFCDTFGKYYSLHENGEILGSFDQQLLDTICPAGWHVPSVDEWTVLKQTLGEGEKTALRLISSMKIDELYAGDTTYLNERLGYSVGSFFTPGTDDCSFNSILAGSLNSYGDIDAGFVTSRYWTSSARDFSSSYGFSFNISGFYLPMNLDKMSIRCIKN